eukprot:scaffold185544_cov16-Prasinocladus_malaysianus.AAC.1
MVETLAAVQNLTLRGTVVGPALLQHSCACAKQMIWYPHFSAGDAMALRNTQSRVNRIFRAVNETGQKDI